MRFAPRALAAMLAPAAALAAGLALAGCGHSDKASDAASPDNVEMPAEEAMSAVPPGVEAVSDGMAAQGGMADSAGAATGGAASGAVSGAASGAASGTVPARAQ